MQIGISKESNIRINTKALISSCDILATETENREYQAKLQNRVVTIEEKRVSVHSGYATPLHNTVVAQPSMESPLVHIFIL